MNLTVRRTSLSDTASSSPWCDSPTTSPWSWGYTPACAVLNMLPEGLSRSLVGAATLRSQMTSNVACRAALLLEGGLLVKTGFIVEPVRGVATGVAGAGGYPKHTGSWFKINSTLE